MTGTGPGTGTRRALASVVALGGLPTDELLDRLLPLLRAARDAHDDGLVVDVDALEGIAVTESGDWVLAAAPTRPRLDAAAVARVQAAQAGALQVVDRGTLTQDVGAGQTFLDTTIIQPGTTITHPGHLPGYRTWESAVGQHDALTDIFILGEILASLACGLDLFDDVDHEAFVDARDDLFRIAPDVHPVIARAVREMTETDRRLRAQDLRSLIGRLETYRDQPEDFDPTNLAGATPGATPRTVVLERLRDRLFDSTRRNRLLYFKATQQTIDLTVASVPQMLDHERIRAESLLTWQATTAAALASGRHLTLGSYVRFEENPFLTGSLDRIISQAKRDRAEYGFAQLRLVVSFLRWHDLRGVADEVVNSPLLLVPVGLVKKKGVRDAYVLTADTSDAEVNPTLRHRLAELYDLHLPERVPLTWAAVAAFHADLAARIQASEPGVSVETVDKPRIDLIQREARLHAALFARRRTRTSARSRRAVRTEHSYRRDGYDPRGLQLFRSTVRPTPLPQRVTAGGTLGPRTPAAMPAATSDATPTAPPDATSDAPSDASPTAPPDATSDAPSDASPAAPPTATPADRPGVVTRATYTLRPGATRGNPFAWEIDLCRVTLGNFSYRRMSLVQDYTRLLATAPTPSAFDDAFAQEGTAWDGASTTPPASDQYLVVDGDSTQLQAVARARTGASFVIQGPPGTGKSQTITNLIADYVAQGKRVLFVCEKRAAIDVVFHRLRSSGLDDLCCLIHDSQADKRAFVADLRSTYERHVADDRADDDAAERRRSDLVAGLDDQLSVLHRLTQTLRAPIPGTQTQAVGLLADLIALRSGLRTDVIAGLTDEQRELLPALPAWAGASAPARRLERGLRDVGADPAPSMHPVCRLAPDVLGQDRPVHRAAELIAVARRQLDELAGQARHGDLPDDLLADLPTLLSLADVVDTALGPLRDAGALRLLASSSKDGQAADKLIAEHGRRVLTAAAAQRAAAGWHTPPKQEPAAEAARVARRFERSLLRFVRPSWRAARRMVAEGFTGELSMADALACLVAAHTAAAAVDTLDAQSASEFAVPAVTRLAGYLTTGRALRSSPVASVSRAMARPGEARLDDLVGALQEVTPELHALRRTVDDLWGAGSSPHCSVADATTVLDVLESELDLLPTLLEPLRALADADPVARHALLALPLRADEIELAVGTAAVLRVFAADRAVGLLDGPALRHRIDVVAQARRRLLGTNAAVIRARARHRLVDHLRRASLPAAQLDAPGKVFKKSYAAGRRELEHEFGKVMRYKSIRALAGGVARDVVADLKPIWLMSPLSVSDTLPLASDLFDVVIFDEASQIPVEESVPALHRARQVVVVGDQMQLPPTSFFTAAVDDDSPLDEDDELVGVPLHGTSFLNQAAGNLPSVLLAWHYRSRSEQLIGFSNAAFYAGQLRTVPDLAVHSGELPAISVRDAADAAAGGAEALRRPISYHRLQHGVYADRRNEAEAAYIAALVRDLLSRETGLSIGIVAFSEAQQGAIEGALGRLAGTDPVFAARLEAERDREVDDQFVGLFVKNLENVQGDERDIVILSICYAPDARGRMRMNFGPINATDGEKRLNVIFSRAKHHMVVVASIDHPAITNDWNDGARALKGFLQFADACSRGRLDLAGAVLQACTPRDRLRSDPPGDGMVAQLAAELTRRGYLVEVDLGSSQVRCDLAVRRPGDDAHRLAVLVDHYRGDTIDDQERYVDRPRAFTSRGWSTAHVLATDWLRDPDAVVARLVAELHERSEP